MKTVNIHEAKTHLSRLIEDVVNGEEVIIARAGKPLVRVVPVVTHPRPRKLGALKGRVTEKGDAWEPDAEIEAAFYGDQTMTAPMQVAERHDKRRKAPRKKK